MFAARFAVPRLVLATLAFFTVALCAPWAGAAIFEQCEVGPLMSVPVEPPDLTLQQSGAQAPQLGEMLISELPADASSDDCDGLIVERSGQVPICLLEGASAVADRPIHEVDGTHAEAASGSCFEAELPDQATAPNDDAPTEGPQAGPYALSVSPHPEPAPPFAGEGEIARRVRIEPPVGQHTRVFRPPRR